MKCQVGPLQKIDPFSFFHPSAFFLSFEIPVCILDVCLHFTNIFYVFFFERNIKKIVLGKITLKVGEEKHFCNLLNRKNSFPVLCCCWMSLFSGSLKLDDHHHKLLNCEGEKIQYEVLVVHIFWKSFHLEIFPFFTLLVAWLRKEFYLKKHRGNIRLQLYFADKKR